VGRYKESKDTSRIFNETVRTCGDCRTSSGETAAIFTVPVFAVAVSANDPDSVMVIESGVDPVSGEMDNQLTSEFTSQAMVVSLPIFNGVISF
jgi:hypothetical protein